MLVMVTRACWFRAWSLLMMVHHRYRSVAYPAERIGWGIRGARVSGGRHCRCIVHRRCADMKSRRQYLAMASLAHVINAARMVS